ncbi:MAG: sigma-70 family RNA polymerase sigma factor [Flavobacteriales bacterium]|jgi:RNA polymerase sigma-70 factor (ECF subfamily)|nr:sigma-70 family RNA polymerase sigma factor [Flavobacteriales bacterium]
MNKTLAIDNINLVNYLAPPKVLTEDDVITGCKQGKRSAQNELFNRYSGAMLGIAMRYSNNKTEAEDALQEAFIKIYKNIVKFEGRRDGSLTNWIKTIVVNTTLSLNKKNKKHNYTEDIETTRIGYETIENEVQDIAGTQNKIMHALNQLPSGYRTVFNLYVLEGYSHQEIADILSISVNTSKSQLSKARKFLKKVLGYNEK